MSDYFSDIRQTLTGHFIDYAIGKPKLDFVGRRLFQDVTASAWEQKIMFNNLFDTVLHDTRVPPGSRGKQVKFESESISYSVGQNAIEDTFSNDKLKMEIAQLKGGTSGIAPDFIRNLYMNKVQSIIDDLTYKIDLYDELDKSTKIQTAANYGTQTSAAVAVWTGAGSTPLTSDIMPARKAFYEAVGVYPNKVLISPDAKYALQGNSSIQAYIGNEGTTNGMKMVLDEQLATIFQVNEVIEGVGQYKTDLNSVHIPFYTKTFVYYYEGTGDFKQEPAFGIHLEDRSEAGAKEWFVEPQNYHVEVRRPYVNILIPHTKKVFAGFLITDCV